MAEVVRLHYCEIISQDSIRGEHAQASLDVIIAFSLVYCETIFDLDAISSEAKRLAQMVTGLVGLNRMQDDSAKSAPFALDEMVREAQTMLALREDGTVWGWGAHSRGQAGNGGYGAQNTPAKIAGLTNVVQVAGLYTVGTSFALKSDGTLWAWGSRTHIDGGGSYGDGSTQAYKPMQMKNLPAISALQGGYFMAALDKNGQIFVWGNGQNLYGQCGSGSYVHTPNDLYQYSGGISVATGAHHGVSMKKDGTVWGWGRNYNGQLALESRSTDDYNSSPQLTSVKGAPQKVAVTGIKLNKTTASLAKGKTLQLKATLPPADATNKNVTWKSSSTAIAKVRAKGLVTAVKAGKATITVTTKDGAKTAKCVITVK